MKRICLVSFFVLFIVSLSTSARSENRAFVIGEKVSIRSDVLGEDRELFIYLPQDYEKSMKKYPVLYLANFVYIAHEYASGKAATSMQEFVELFRSERLENLRWASILMERETHYSYVHRAIHEGLEFIYLADKD